MEPTPSSHRMVSTTAAVLAGAALFSTGAFVSGPEIVAAGTAGLAGLLSALAGAGVGLAVLAVPFAMPSHQAGGSTWIF